jgi:hypothetical protein
MRDTRPGCLHDSPTGISSCVGRYCASAIERRTIHGALDGGELHAATLCKCSGLGCPGKLNGAKWLAVGSVKVPIGLYVPTAASYHSGILRWHVQRLGPLSAHARTNPPRRIVLLHGTFSSTHSFRKLAPLLAEGYELLMPDLPGHGWTQGARASDMAMPNMATPAGQLIESLGFYPAVIVGHPAGAALSRCVLA